MRKRAIAQAVGAVAAAGCLAAAMTHASSHREAPFITELPKVDNTDLYMFRSYEGVAADGTGGRSGFVTILANVQPFQERWGGPNYFTLDENAAYHIHIDNDGDALADITYRFQFANEYRKLAVDGDPSDAQEVINPIPLINNGPVTEPEDENLNRLELYSVGVIHEGDDLVVQPATNPVGGADTFLKPVDYIGQKSLPDYPAYAQQHIHEISIPGCEATGGRVFVGQRREGFYINVGETFDLLNFNSGQPPATFAGFARDAAENNLEDKNITTLALEVPVECLVAEDPVIGAWATTHMPQVRVIDPTPSLESPTVQGGPFTQVSRLGSPLVNEVVIGLPDKNLFNATSPVNDVENFGNYILHPTLPVLVNALFGVPVPPTPRTDLVQAFITGIPNLNQPANVDPETLAGGGDMLRLNTSIAPTANPAVGNLGVLACDLAGFPNGRRPVDDVVDISLTAVEGALLEGGGPLQLQACDTSGAAPQVINEGRVITDGVNGSVELFMNTFPYLATPLPGSPNEAVATTDTAEDVTAAEGGGA
jgi:hypothetical protein